MQEWTNKYNSFNSLKGLMYINEYEAILKGKLLPPVNIAIAPIGNCNLNCEWCNSKEVLTRKPQMLTRMRFKKLLNDWLDWGVKGYCFAGTGEPSLYPYLDEMVELINSREGECAMITNGTLINYNPNNFKWIGISLDAGTKETYKKEKGKDLFEKVLENVKELTQSNAEISVKYLIHPNNCEEIYRACKLAKRAGVANFHIRPACLQGFKNVEHKDYTEAQLRLINYQIENCFKEETDTFKVFGVRHKFSPSFGVANDFRSCQASPLLFCAESDGYAYNCLEHRGELMFQLCKLEDIRKFWGSKEHLNFIKSIIPAEDCQARCTLIGYQEQIEQAVAKDKMNRRFP